MERDLDLSEAAEILGVSRKTIGRWVREGVIPTHRHSGRQTFRRVELLQWAREHRLGRVEREPGGERPGPSSNLARALTAGRVMDELPGKNVQEVLKTAVQWAPLGDHVDRTLLLEHLLNRESIVSTGIGDGVALPHPHNPADLGFRKSRVSCFYLKEAVDYRALDGQFVTCLFLILAVDTDDHLKLMSQLAHALSAPSFREMLKKRASLADLLAAYETLGISTT